MLGHKMFQQLQRKVRGTHCTIRGSVNDTNLCNIDLFRSGNVFERFDATDIGVLNHFLLEHRPKVIVNCIGIVKQRAISDKALPNILTNALLPHQLSEICRGWGGKLIHISTDCVFSGRRGDYREEDLTDAEDLYGRTKSLGEVMAENVLTLRTSIIGRELANFHSLLEWFLAQGHTRVRGYRRAMFSGTTTNQLTSIVCDVIEKYPDLVGLYHVTGPTISKFDLLSLVRDAYALDIEIIPDNEFSCDRSLSGEKFHAATGYASPGWGELVERLAQDETPYEHWRALKNEVL